MKTRGKHAFFHIICDSYQLLVIATIMSNRAKMLKAVVEHNVGTVTMLGVQLGCTLKIICSIPRY